MEIDWRKDYKNEFACPRCKTDGLKLAGKDNHTGKRLFICPGCNRTVSSSLNIKFPNPRTGINWRKDYVIGDFACSVSNCNSRDIRIAGTKKGKQQFKCNVCKVKIIESIDITSRTLSYYASSIPVRPFFFDNDEWDLRAINPSFDKRENRFIANFKEITKNWFKVFVKQYIYHLCKLNKSFGTIEDSLCQFRVFSRYLSEKEVHSINVVTRGLFLDFLIWDKAGSPGTRKRLSTLKNFFLIGTSQNWFEIDQDIIRGEDYPKYKISNPDPIPDSVRKEIEKNLYKLPEAIARMWIISFFTAMRPSELALLKKDCLVQEGSHWKIVWQRKKGKDCHEVPVTRIIAKVIQEQQEYIELLWGLDWDYLFCHYQKPPGNKKIFKFNPVKRVIPKRSPLQKGIEHLIETENIQDENGYLSKFSDCLVRPTRLTQLYEQGHDLSVVSAWAGHKHLATTSNFYTQVSCDLIEKEVGHIQKALFNSDGKYFQYESLPKSFWESPQEHKLDLPADHINTPIYGYCGLPLDQRCDKFRACYTCRSFVAPPEKLSSYIKTRDELRVKESNALANGQDVLVEQFGRQAEQLDKIIASLQEAA